MKRKQIIQPNFNITLNKDTPAETLVKLFVALNGEEEKPKVKKKVELFLLNTDIEELHKRYAELFTQVKSCIDLSEEQIKKECNVLSDKYDFEVAELSKMRELEYDEMQAQIKAKRHEQKPYRRSWLWRLIFRPTTNRAQDIIEERAALEADARFTAEEKVLDDQVNELYGNNVELSQRKRKRLMKKFFKLQRILEGENTGNASDDVHVNREQPAPMGNAKPTDGATLEATAHDDVHTIEPPEPPARKPRKPKQAGA